MELSDYQRQAAGTDIRPPATSCCPYSAWPVRSAS